MLIGVLSIFSAFNLDLSSRSSFISYCQDYTCSWFIFILANSCRYFNYDHFSRTLHSRLIVYTDAHSDEKGCTSLKEGTKQKERKASVLISIWCNMFNIWIRTSSQSAIFHVARRRSWALVRRHQYISHSVTCYSWNILFLFTN